MRYSGIWMIGWVEDMGDLREVGVFVAFQASVGLHDKGTKPYHSYYIGILMRRKMYILGNGCIWFMSWRHFKRCVACSQLATLFSEVSDIMSRASIVRRIMNDTMHTHTFAHI